MAYKIGTKIIVNDKMQQGYEYILSTTMGEDFDQNFTPYLTPKEMLEKGVFEGKYCNDCQEELPKNWFEKAKLSDVPDVSLNFFEKKSRQPLSVWRKKGWIIGDDPRGWFQWYFRYYLGRRDPQVDKYQIKRWKAFIRHEAQVRKNCMRGDLTCRPRQRQALLQWAYNPFI